MPSIAEADGVMIETSAPPLIRDTARVMHCPAPQSIGEYHVSRVAAVSCLSADLLERAFEDFDPALRIDKGGIEAHVGQGCQSRSFAIFQRSAHDTALLCRAQPECGIFMAG